MSPPQAQNSDILTSFSAAIGQIPACLGFCRTCGREHNLGSCLAGAHGVELMAALRTRESLDLSTSSPPAEHSLSTNSLYGEARGKMFGVLECRDQNGSTIVLRAFSGQFNGRWEIDGWAPPLFDSREMEATCAAPEKEIKRLGARMAEADCQPALRLALAKERRHLSRSLMARVHSLYRLRNFRGQESGLQAAWTGPGGIPTGAGDCCAPKLLNLAARKNLIPLGMAEFYWGRENKSATRQEGSFYPACSDKCAPILGFMLCGLEELHARLCR